MDSPASQLQKFADYGVDSMNVGSEEAPQYADVAVPINHC
jgi:hypothetical protein